MVRVPPLRVLGQRVRPWHRPNRQGRRKLGKQVCRVAVTTFKADRSSVAEARRWAGKALASWSLDHLAETTVLLLSEVVTNAVVHAGNRPRVRLAVTSGVLEVGVDDDEPRLPDRGRLGDYRQGTPDPEVLLAEGGRGLLLIDALADEWGAVVLAAGKQVWFHQDLGDWAYRADCLCDDHSTGQVTLGSGLRARHLPGHWPFGADTSLAGVQVPESQYSDVVLGDGVAYQAVHDPEADSIGVVGLDGVAQHGETVVE
jgi:anti-sigma regulatory factor (Ser/Thr protein kinase)